MASTPVDMSGTIDGRTVRWNYKRSEDGKDEKKMLSWAEGGAPHSEWTHIPADNVIAVGPRAEVNGTYTILYSVENPAKDASGASPVVFKSCEATQLPPDFVHDYSVSGPSCLETRASPQTPGGPPNIHIIISTGSGTGVAKDVFTKLVEPLLAHFYSKKDYVVHTTNSDQAINHLTEVTILPRANDGIHQSIILLSGDGGVIDMVNTLLSAPHTPTYIKPTLSLLPLGTGNALATSAGLNSSATLGLSSLIRGSPREIPTFTTTFSPGARLLADEARSSVPLPEVNGVPTTYGTVVVSWGFHASLVADSDTAAYRKHGATRFGMAANEALYPSDGSAPHAYRGRVSVLRGENWQPIPRTEHGYVVATLCSNFEKTFHISPSSRPLDGKMYIVHFAPLSGDETMEVMKLAYDGGKHVGDKKVGYEEIRGMRVEFAEDGEDGRWRRVCVDGKIVRVERGGWVEVRVGEVEGVVDLVVQE